MKSLLAVVTMLALGGCAVAPQPYYARAPQQSYDPYQWHPVSSETVQNAPVVQAGQYASAPVYSTPVYVDQPVYVSQPYYYAPQPAYYYPPVSIGLDFGFWGGGHRGGWGGRGWGGGYHGRR